MKLRNVEEQYKRFAVKIKCDGIEGSGCLVTNYNKTNSYILTAKHCLTETDKCDKESIKVKRFLADKDEPSLTIEKVILHEILDLAIIVLQNVYEENVIAFENPSKDQPVQIYGYPAQLIGQKEPRENLSCKISFVHEDHFEVSSDLIQFTYDQGIPENIKGFSGSGVYKEKEQKLILNGIFVRLKGPKGAYNKLCSINVDEYLKLMSSNGYDYDTNLNNIENIIKDGTTTKKVFYLPYTIDSEPYYLERETDNTFKALLNSSKDIWISGNSGVGKTNLVFRNLAVINRAYIFIDLSANENKTIEQYFEYINAEILDQFNIQEPISKSNIYDSIVHNILKVETESSETILFIDEIPIADLEKFNEFLNGFILISEKYNSVVKGNKIIKWIISTRIDPTKHLKKQESLLSNSAKAKKNFNFKNLELWQPGELNELMNILKEALNFKLSMQSQNHIILISKGFPGVLKDSIERIVIENCSVEKAIQYINAENNQS